MYQEFSDWELDLAEILACFNCHVKREDMEEALLSKISNKGYF